MIAHFGTIKPRSLLAVNKTRCQLPIMACHPPRYIRYALLHILTGTDQCTQWQQNRKLARHNLHLNCLQCLPAQSDCTNTLFYFVSMTGLNGHAIFTESEKQSTRLIEHLVGDCELAIVRYAPFSTALWLRSHWLIESIKLDYLGAFRNKKKFDAKSAKACKGIEQMRCSLQCCRTYVRS